MGRPGIKLENHTRWNTLELRALVHAGLSAHGLLGCKVIVKYRRRGTGCLGRAYVGKRGDVTQAARVMWLYLERSADAFTYARCDAGCNGGFIHNETLSPHNFGAWCIICRGTANIVVSRRTLTPSELAYKTALTIDHEIYHLRGLHHRSFPKHVPRHGGEDHLPHVKVPWFTDDMTLSLRPEVEKAAPTLDEKRQEALEHAQLAQKRAETRLKRATTIAKKWRAKVKRLEKLVELPLAAKRNTP